MFGNHYHLQSKIINKNGVNQDNIDKNTSKLREQKIQNAKEHYRKFTKYSERAQKRKHKMKLYYQNLKAEERINKEITETRRTCLR